MKDYKIGLIVFLFLATIISLFPPYEWYFHSLRKTENYHEVVIGKAYDFIFRINQYDSFVKKYGDGEQYINYRRLLVVELAVEYLLAGFIAFFVQIIITFVKRKTLNKKST